jgi:hypothetical protein
MDSRDRSDAINDEGTIMATTRQMSDDQAAAVAKQIFALDSHYRPPYDD